MTIEHIRLTSDGSSVGEDPSDDSNANALSIVGDVEKESREAGIHETIEKVLIIAEN